MQQMGLYDPANEHDGCGVAMVVRPDNVATHEAVRRGLESLCNLEHRGSEGADAGTGDGAGILLQLPDRFFRSVVDFTLPEKGAYAVAMCFLPKEPARRAELEGLLSDQMLAQGLTVIGSRDVPVRQDTIGRVARDAAPLIRQLFIVERQPSGDVDNFERQLYIARRRAEIASGEELTIPSCSARTIIYKGMLSAPQLGPYFP